MKKKMILIMFFVLILSVKVMANSTDQVNETNPVKAILEDKGTNKENINKGSTGSIFSFENIIFVGAAIAIYFLFFRDSDKSNLEEADTIQELLEYEEIELNGLICLSENRYRFMVQVYPTNLPTKSLEEQASVWESYRNTLDTLMIDYTIVGQSRLLYIKDHIDDINKQVNEIRTKFPKLAEYGENTIRYLNEKYQDSGQRSKSFFIIFKVDSNEFQAEQSEMGIDSTAISAFLSDKGKKKKHTNDELKAMAISELEHAVNLAMQGLMRQGVLVKPLEKMEVLDFMNNHFNREIAKIHSIEKLNESGVFKFVPKSLTIDLFLSKTALKQVLDREKEETIDFLYEDETNKDKPNESSEEVA